jgi:hypothetical protein
VRVDPSTTPPLVTELQECDLAVSLDVGRPIDDENAIAIERRLSSSC